jgi:hypothetical protein
MPAMPSFSRVGRSGNNGFSGLELEFAAKTVAGNWHVFVIFPKMKSMLRRQPLRPGPRLPLRGGRAFDDGTLVGAQ